MVAEHYHPCFFYYLFFYYYLSSNSFHRRTCIYFMLRRNMNCTVILTQKRVNIFASEMEFKVEIIGLWTR